MKMAIKEFARCTGVSVRTLHYYDEIGLLKPAYVDPQTGYRFYDDHCLLRMQEIMFYRELDFPLKSIAAILSSPHYDQGEALAEQKQLLILKKERLERLILAIDHAVKGENVMSAFDNHDFEAYREEAKERWGDTATYQEYEQRPQTDANDLVTGLEGIMAEFAACMQGGADPASCEAQILVKKLQNFITATCYTCTKEILAGLGQMYVGDDRFRQNIDKHAVGTAQFVSAAILAYCQ